MEIKSALIDLIDRIYRTCGNFDILIFLLPVIILFVAIYLCVRAVWHKRRFGNDFAAIRRSSRLNEFIRSLLVCWGIFICCGLLTPSEFWYHFWKCMVHGSDPFEDFWSTSYVPNLIPYLVRCAVNGHLDYLVKSTHHMIHFLLNVSLFLPFGLLFPFIYKKATLAKVTLIGSSLSLVVEIAQIFINGRDCDIDDLLCNVLGTVIGYLIYAFVKKILPEFARKCKLSAADAFCELSGIDAQT